MTSLVATAILGEACGREPSLRALEIADRDGVRISGGDAVEGRSAQLHEGCIDARPYALKSQ
jgi:hypothetical protein